MARPSGCQEIITYTGIWLSRRGHGLLFSSYCVKNLLGIQILKVIFNHLHLQLFLLDEVYTLKWTIWLGSCRTVILCLVE